MVANSLCLFQRRTYAKYYNIFKFSPSDNTKIFGTFTKTLEFFLFYNNYIVTSTCNLKHYCNYKIRLTCIKFVDVFLNKPTIFFF